PAEALARGRGRVAGDAGTHEAAAARLGVFASDRPRRRPGSALARPHCGRNARKVGVGRALRPLPRLRHAAKGIRIPSRRLEDAMADTPEYTPPKVWTWNKDAEHRFSAINRPIAGPTHEKELPVGRHPFQLYSLATPNGVKVTVMFEELLALGHAGAEYDAWPINILAGEQFGSGFVAVNPNSKIPALLDRSDPARPIRVFESGAILVHLAEKFGAFLPTERAARAECLSWLFWQMGAGPFLGGGFGHFYA